MNRANQRDHAIVIGMAGLLAARVTLLERDALPAPRENRRGVPQSLHTHGLLNGGCQVLEALFPGIAGQMLASVAPIRSEG
jgi:hypothetical protein